MNNRTTLDAAVVAARLTTLTTVDREQLTRAAVGEGLNKGSGVNSQATR